MHQWSQVTIKPATWIKMCVRSFHVDLKEPCHFICLLFFKWPFHTFSFRGYSLLVMKIPTLKSLGLRSLKRMGDGGIYITGNKQLCYHHTVNWTRLLGSSPRRRQKPLDIKDNHPQELCSEYMLYHQNVHNGLVMGCLNDYSLSLGSCF